MRLLFSKNKQMKNIILLLSLCMVSCVHVSENMRHEAKDMISFSNSNVENNESLFDVRYIKPATNDSCLLGAIGQIEMVSDSFLIILDINNYSLYAFSPDGKFLSTIGSKGDGPGEYIKPSSFFVDKLRNRIGIVDIGRQKVIYYRMKDFLFQSEKMLPFETNSCAVAEDGNILWNSIGYDSSDIGDNYFVLTDSTFQIIETAVEKQFKSGYGFGDSRNVYAFQGKTYAFSPYDSGVWEIGDGCVEKRFELDLDDHTAPPYSFLMEKSNGGQNPYFRALEESDYVSYYTIREFANYCSVLYIVNNERFVGFFDKRTKSSYLYTLELFGKMLKVGDMSYLASGFFNDYSVFPLNISNLLEMRSDGYSFSKDLDILLQNSSPEDNQILMCVRMR